ncbi:dTDP-4-dehydrorhamnose 3,5-epimerase [Caulobacter sp. NIBR2454]|uniref:dTDP-4-dehydrorhamnose 3,5-epimerase n=1 Tax=Caulobacter sp. NIBR2454 TaxID=3015996 RepID=UPI0022B646EC|nr:dTDP-4-dehydrorhamnose 3,5-epimerase [Caulobacter sp. NIBR2454]
MDVKRLTIPEVMVLKPPRLRDTRGFFTELYSLQKTAELGLPTFVQDNMSLSEEAGTLRGLHFQSPPHAQAKLVSVLTGAILDVAVDARLGSPTYGHHVSHVLDCEAGEQMYVPVGFLHGFVTLQPQTRVLYKVSDIYAPACDGAVRWDDPDLAIDWGLTQGAATLSPKDASAQAFADFTSPFQHAPSEPTL